jgi:hypothetical protein
MLNARCEDEQIPRFQWIRAAQCLKDNLALEHVYGNGSVGAMRRQISTRRNANHGKPQQSFLDECARAPPVLGEEYWVNHSLVLG